MVDRSTIHKITLQRSLESCPIKSAHIRKTVKIYSHATLFMPNANCMYFISTEYKLQFNKLYKTIRIITKELFIEFDPYF